MGMDEIRRDDDIAVAGDAVGDEIIYEDPVGVGGSAIVRLERGDIRFLHARDARNDEQAPVRPVQTVRQLIVGVGIDRDGVDNGPLRI